MKRLALVVALSVLFALVVLALAINADSQLPIQPEPIVDTQNPPPADPSLLAEWTKATAGGWAIRMPRGGIYNIVDVQCGEIVHNEDGTLDKEKLNCNFGAGNRQHPGYVVLVADVGKGVIVDNGEPRPKKLLVVQNPRWGRSEFRTPVWFKKGLVACDRQGCIDVVRAIRGLRHR